MMLSGGQDFNEMSFHLTDYEALSKFSDPYVLVRKNYVERRSANVSNPDDIPIVKSPKQKIGVEPVSTTETQDK